MLLAVGELLNANPSAWRLSGEICFSAARRKICALNDQSPENFRWPAMLADCRTQQRTVRADTDKLRGGSWFRWYLYILRFVDLTSRYIYVIKSNLMQYLTSADCLLAGFANRQSTTSTTGNNCCIYTVQLCWPCITIYLCNKNQLDAVFILSWLSVGRVCQQTVN